MHPNKQFLGLFVVHMPSSLHVLLRGTHSVCSLGGRGMRGRRNHHFGYSPLGCVDNVAPKWLLFKGRGEGASTLWDVQVCAVARQRKSRKTNTLKQLSQIRCTVQPMRSPLTSPRKYDVLTTKPSSWSTVIFFSNQISQSECAKASRLGLGLGSPSWWNQFWFYGNAMHAVRTQCAQCARSAKFWMSANTRTVVLAPFHKFLVPYQGFFFGFLSI